MSRERPDGTRRYDVFEATEFFPNFRDIQFWGGGWGNYILNAGYNLFKAYRSSDLKHQRDIARGLGMSVEELDAFRDWTNMILPSMLVDYAWALLLLGYDMGEIIEGYDGGTFGMQ